MSPQEQIVARFAPTGTLRAAINLGNPILAGSDPATGAAPASRSTWRRNSAGASASPSSC